MSRIDPEMTRRARELRNNPTPAERRIWLRISCFRPRFTRQLVVGRFIVDPACREAKLAIEFDGSQHIESDQCSFSFGRTIWLTCPITISATPRHQPWIAIKCMR
jgi:very-short-patch-repair endonuclease